MRKALCFVGAMSVLLLSGGAPASEPRKELIEAQPFTVRDSITWTNVLPFASAESNAPVMALFSPDGSHFVLHTVRGDLTRNVNVHALLLYSTKDVQAYGRSSGGSREVPAARSIATIDAAADEDAPAGIQWLSNSTIGYIARSKDRRLQAFAADISSRSASQISASDTDVMGFSLAGGMHAYYACVPAEKNDPVVVIVDSLDKAVPSVSLAGNGASTCFEESPVSLFAGPKGQIAKQLPLPASQLYQYMKRIWMAPTGDYAVIVAPVADAPEYWAEYTGPLREQWGYATPFDGRDRMQDMNRTRYLLVNLRTGKIDPLLDAPTGQMSLNYTPAEVFWRDDGRSVVVTNTFLPLQGVDVTERQHRSRQPAIAEVDVSSGVITPVAWEEFAHDRQTPLATYIVGFQWDGRADRLTVIQEHSTDGAISRLSYVKHGRVWQKKQAPEHSVRGFDIEEQQSLNERPKIFVRSANAGTAKLILDPNPDADHRRFGKTQVYRWTDANGKTWTGGLLLPPGHNPGTRYPLVVQTHGFKPDRFLLDGPSDGRGAGTAFAAQALANAGFVVLQIEDNPTTITNDHREGPSVAEGFRAGIQQLISEGRVDADRIGLIAFSRTGYHALHLVAQHPEMIRALTMSDTLYASYNSFMYNVTRPAVTAELAKLTQGKPDFARLGQWFDNQPVYALRNSQAAIRIEGIYQGLGMWELYAVARDAGRPVEYVLYPHGVHVLKKPEERLSSQGGNVDWFRFWLQNYEDPDPDKRAQYQRWRKLREAQTQIQASR